MEVHLDLTTDLIAKCDNANTLQEIVSCGFFKISIKRYVSTYKDNVIVFKNDLSYLVMKRIVDAFSQNAIRLGYECIVSPTVVEFINSREMYLDIRSKLGMELKQHSEKVTPEYQAFCCAIEEQFERRLRERQLWDAFFMLSMKKSCNFSVPGSGKTSSVYAVFSYLMNLGVLKQLVVVCPKNAFGPWIDEFHMCFGRKLNLTLFSIQDDAYHTRLQKVNAIQYESGGCNVLLFNYECLKTYQDPIRNIIGPNTLLVFDEVHKIKRIDGEYAKAALSIAKQASHIIAMTGTPIPNSYSDIYNLLHILYPDEYEDFFGFSVGQLKNPHSADVDRINRKIQPFFCRTTKSQLNVPAPNTDSILPVAAAPQETELFRILMKKYKKNKLLLMLRILQLESNPRQLLDSIDLAEFQYILDDDNPIDEIDYADYSEDIVTLIKSFHRTSKVTQCVNTIRALTLQNKPVVLWCIFVKTIQTLSNELTKMGISARCVYGEVELSEREKLLRDFKNGEYQVLITNPNTLAESISLHNICHDAVYFEYSFNLVHLLQSKDRIHRLGLPEGQYTQFYFLQTMYPYNNSYYSMDESIYSRLQEKEKRMLEAIEADQLEIMPTTDEELDLIFQSIGL